MGALRRKAAVVLAGAGAVSLLTAGAAGAVPGLTPTHGPQPKPVPQSTMVPGTGCTLGQVEKALAKEDPSGWEEINEAPPLKANFERIIVLTPEQRAAYTAQAQERVLAGQRRLASAIAGGRPMFERPADRRFDHDESEKAQEAAMLLDAASRLGEDGVYRR